MIYRIACLIFLVIFFSPAIFSACGFCDDGSYTGYWTDYDGNNYYGDPPQAVDSSSYSTYDSSSYDTSYSSYTPSWQEQQAAQTRATGISFNETGNAYLSSRDFQSAINYYTQSLQYIPNDPVVQENLRKAEGCLLNEQANRLYEKGDYKSALEYYRQALEKRPYDAVVRQNLENAKYYVEQEEQRRQEEEDRAQMGRDISQKLGKLDDVLKDASADIQGLGFQTGADKNTGSQGELQFMPASGGKLEAFKNMNPEKPDLEARTAVSQDGSENKGGQLRSIFDNIKNVFGGSPERMKQEAGTGFDTAGAPRQGLEPFKVTPMEHGSNRDPKVTKEQRTPKIDQLETQRTEIRNERWNMQKQLDELNKAQEKDTEKINELTTKINDTKEQEQFLNFSIKEELSTAPQVKKEDKK